MCVKETLRLTQSPSFLRGLERDTEIDGYLLKEGTVVQAPFILLNFDPLKFPEPEKFNPERWRGNATFVGDNNNFLGFGMGLHRCKGDMYSLQAIKSIIATLLLEWNFELEGNEGAKINWSKLRRPEKDIYITITKKN